MCIYFPIGIKDLMVDLKGLTSEEAQKRLHKYGPNKLPEEKPHFILHFLGKFWAPVPWMLEVIILLELVLGKWAEAWIIAALTLFNALMSLLEEGKAKHSLSLLRNKLRIQARVLRDNQWRTILAEDLVPGDLIRCRMGDIIPADSLLIEGSLSIDQSTVTGESLPIEPLPGATLYASTLVKHGEASAKVISTGRATFYGKTAEIMSGAKTPTHLQQTILLIVKYLMAFNVFLIFFLFVFSFFHTIPFSELIPFSLLIFVASVPVALPATYALSTALGSMELAKKGVLVTRLSSIEEAAAMSNLCVDKTGTITKNELTIAGAKTFQPYSNDDLFALAALACEEATQDPLDLAILKKAREGKSQFDSLIRTQFIPFDPATKCSEAFVEGGEHIIKGAPLELLKKISLKEDVSSDMELLSSNGSRLLAVTFNNMLVGFIAFQDLPRETSLESIREIQELGVKITMLTGDGAATAKWIGHEVGIGSHLLSRDKLAHTSDNEIVQSDIIYGVFPEDKFEIIQILQKNGHICGMTGDGVNDAPALKASEVGIAVRDATDVAKAAASLVLTKEGLVNIVDAIKVSRCIYQRMLTYTLNKIIKTFAISILLGLGLILTNQFIISQLLIVLLLFANDFISMSISTDRVHFSRTPDQWDIRKLMGVGGIFALLVLLFSFFILYVGMTFLHLSIEEIRTLVFLTLVFTGQATIYLIREKKHFWHSRPSQWIIFSSLFDIGVTSWMGAQGILMAPLPFYLIASLILVVILYFIAIDVLRGWILKQN